MKILGIETSCDETAISVVEASGDFSGGFSFRVLGNALSSQAKLHAEYGGVFPNLAKREHAKNLVPMLSAALQLPETERRDVGEAIEDLRILLNREPELFELLVPYIETHGKPDIDAIAVTAGPGLEPALWVGINFAKALAQIWNLPIVAVNHMEGHVLLSLIEHQEVASFQSFQFPVLALLISGGHTELILCREPLSYTLVGQTRDDAAGEAFDKVARLLDLPYPGGPEISRLAQEARTQRLEADFSFTRPMIREKNYDFSFSGLKTAVRTLAEERSPLSDTDKKKIAREFEDAVAEVLVEKTLRAAEEYGVSTIVVGGGVSANDHIRKTLSERVEEEKIAGTVLFPPPERATDNAIMIALAGYFHAIRNEYTEPDALSAMGNLRLENRQ